MTRGSGYEAGHTPASELKPPPAGLTSVGRAAAKLAATRPITEAFGLTLTQKSRWRPGVEVDITVRVRSHAELEAAREEIKALAMRAFRALEVTEDEATDRA